MYSISHVYGGRRQQSTFGSSSSDLEGLASAPPRKLTKVETGRQSTNTDTGTVTGAARTTSPLDIDESTSLEPPYLTGIATTSPLDTDSISSLETNTLTSEHRPTSPSQIRTPTPSAAPTTSPSEPRPLILPTVVSANSRANKRLSLGLEGELIRSKQQRHTKDAVRRKWASIGNIPADQLRQFQRSQEGEGVEIRRRRGQSWTGPPIRVMPSGGVRLSGGPVLSDAEASMLESDVSSVVSLNDRISLSDTDDEDEDDLQDKQKYRMPDIGKTRLHLRTKEPLSPNPRPVPRSPRRQQSSPTPSTPRNMQTNTTGPSPMQPNFPNGSSESVGESDFYSSGLSRAGSIYTLGRASLAGQLAHLTSLRLPDANSLAKKISEIPTSAEAARALSDASEQIRLWISKASDVLNGLNAEDDVEWAAAGGREGIEDVDKAITRFQNLVEVYVLSIERLQTRDDAASLSAGELNSCVKQMEGILTNWQDIKQTLKGVKEQVEIAMEWEELWNNVLGEIAQEMEGLNRLVFEMEEKRHQGAESLLSSKDSIDINELETIVEERPGRGEALSSNRFSLPPFSPTSPIENTQENRDSNGDSSLLALFARMQPLRASLDFLPMRLSAFHTRGNEVFPSAYQDLELRRDQLEEQWKKLEADAESLRRELGEDRWILVFRNAGRQALKMEESITRSFAKLKEALDCSEHQSNWPSFAKRIENYEAKKVHYGPAIERVLAIIDRGVLDRLTVNGEILRIQSDMKSRWSALQAEMRDMDLVLEDLGSDSNRDKQLRDSVSTVMSSERSVSSSLVDTPGSSPASSVVGTSRKSSLQGSRTPTPLVNGKTWKSSSRMSSSIPRRIPLTQSGEFTTQPYASPLATRSELIAPTRNELLESTRPRWNATRTVQNRDFKPLSTFEPSKYAKAPVVKQTNFLRATSSSYPTNSPTTSRTIPSRVVSTPNPKPALQTPPLTVPSKPSTTSIPTTRKSSLPVPKTTTTPARATSAMGTTPRSSSLNLRTPSTQPPANGRRSSLLPRIPPPKFTDGNDADTESPSHHKSRPSSALADVLAGGRRSSMLPMRTRGNSGYLGTDSGGGLDERPKWRP